jgi:hypothetical protein
VDAYLYIEQYICYALDTLYIIYFYLILLQIFSKFHTIFFKFSIYFFIFSLHFLGAPAKIN